MPAGPEREAVAQNVVNMIADLQEIINNETNRLNSMMATHRHNPEETIHRDGHHPTQTAMTQADFDHMLNELREKKNNRIASMSDDALAAENNNFEVNMALFLRNYQKQLHQMMYHNPHHDTVSHQKLGHDHHHQLDHHDESHHHLDQNHHNLHQNHHNLHQHHVQVPQHIHDPNSDHNDLYNSQNEQHNRIHNSANVKINNQNNVVV